MDTESPSNDIHTWVIFGTVALGMITVALMFIIAVVTQADAQYVTAAFGAVGTLAGFVLGHGSAIASAESAEKRARAAARRADALTQQLSARANSTQDIAPRPPNG